MAESCSIERIILGTSGIGGLWGKPAPGEPEETILAALAAGITAIDTAPAYGDAELHVGRALQQWKGEQPAISTKAGRLRGYSVNDGNYDYSAAGMLASVENSLAVLNIPVLDILFLHDPQHLPPDKIGEVLHGLTLIKNKGYAKAIGLGGNPPAWFLPHLYSGDFEVLMEFNRLNACNITALEDSLLQCKAHHLRYFAASPLNMGLLGKCFEQFVADPPEWLNRPVIKKALLLKALADKNNLELAAMAIRYLLSKPGDFQIVIGPSNRKELEQTLSILKQGPLPAELMVEIEAINRPN